MDLVSEKVQREKELTKANEDLLEEVTRLKEDEAPTNLNPWPKLWAVLRLRQGDWLWCS